MNMRIEQWWTDTEKGKTEVLGEKPVPLTCDRTGASEVRGQRLKSELHPSNVQNISLYLMENSGSRVKAAWEYNSSLLQESYKTQSFCNVNGGYASFNQSPLRA